MKYKVRVLQIASFEGNIGDNANLIGARSKMAEHIDYEFAFTNIEIREFFWRERFFDEEFANLVNGFDLFLFGGGNFFELWVNHSSNNTSVDISIPILEKIRTPTVFYALGLDAGMGTSEAGIAKFKKWLDYVIAQDRFVLSLRNDGSYNTAIQLLGNTYAKHFHVLPDGGFFSIPDKFDFHSEIVPSNNGNIIGMNIAGDMLDVRFPDILGQISYKVFLNNLANCFNKLFSVDKEVSLVLYPHIYKDISVISDFLSLINDKYVRKRITVAPYSHGFSAYHYIFDSYRKCNLIIGNRFHANVCAIGLNIPTIGIVNYPQIQYLYEEIGIPERSIQVNIPGFEARLYEMIIKTLRNQVEIKQQYTEIMSVMEQQSNSFHRFMNEWFSLFDNKRMTKRLN